MHLRKLEQKEYYILKMQRENSFDIWD